MEDITIEELERKARLFQEQGKKWHFHMLTPDCHFNSNEKKHAFVLENNSDNEFFVTYSDERHMEVGKRLVKIIHGNKILEENEKRDISDPAMRQIIERAKGLNNKSKLWHHHLLFPACIFNKHKGKWNIIFEDKENDKILEAIFDNEPVNELREIEILYYQQKK